MDKALLKKIKRGEKKIERRSTGEMVFLWILCILCVLYTISLFYPLYWTIINSLKSTREFFKSPYELPGRNINGEQFHATIENFKEALQVTEASRYVFKQRVYYLYGSVDCSYRMYYDGIRSFDVPFPGE